MLLFKPEHVEPIQTFLKTETRRTWDTPRVTVGSFQKAKTKMLSTDYFALLYITGVHREFLMDITEEGAKAEGGYTRASYLDKFFEIYPEVAKLTDYGKVPYPLWTVKYGTVRIVKENKPVNVLTCQNCPIAWCKQYPIHWYCHLNALLIQYDAKQEKVKT
jgi:hypothetical protein